MDKVLVVATSRKTRGGITSVLKAYEATDVWTRFSCHWCQTHRDGPAWRKIFYFITGMVDFLVRLPFYDIVHIHTADYGTQRRKRIFAKIAKMAGKKLVVHLHSSGQEFSVESRYKESYDETFRVADRILVLSTQWRDAILRNYDVSPNKVIVQYNPCPQIDLSDKREIEKSPKYILFAGTLTHRKGYDDLIKAFARVKDETEGWQLWLAGNGELDNAAALTAAYNLKGCVRLLGWISGTEKDRIFSEASAYCLPSYSEGFPMGVLDAWAYGIPVITTPVGGLPDVAVDGENSLLFYPGDIAALSDCIKRIISDSILRDNLKSNGLRLSLDKFNVANLSDRLVGIYSDL